MKKQTNDIAEEEYLDKTLRYNKPSVVFPLISTCFALALLIALIMLFIKKEVKIGFLIFGIVICLLIPISSWYTNFFAKKKTTKQIFNFQDETEKLIKFTNKLKGFNSIEITDTNYPEFEFSYDENLKLESSTFDKETCLINNGTFVGTLMTFGVSFGGIIVNPKNNVVQNVSGFIPESIFYKSALKVPNSKKGVIKVKHPDITAACVMKFNKNDNLYYDHKSGWLCIGNKKAKENNENIRFLENAILVLNDNRVESLWINIGKDIN